MTKVDRFDKLRSDVRVVPDERAGPTSEPIRAPKARRRRWRWWIWAIVIVLVLPILAAGIGYVAQFGRHVEPESAPYPHVPADVSLGSLTSHPAFSEFGEMMNPFQPGGVTTLTSPLALNKVTGYLNWDAETIVNGVNFVIEEVNNDDAEYEPLYTGEEIEADPSKARAGVLVFPGNPGAPTAVVLAGGGWRAQANIQEAFPLAGILHEDGYTVAVVRYRIGTHPDDPKREDDPTGGREAAVIRSQEDLAAAFTLLDSNAERWNINLANYAVWGSSAGAQLAMQWGTDNPLGARSVGLPSPTAIVAAYPPDYFWNPPTDYPPLYVIAAESDTLVPIAGTDEIITELQRTGQLVKYRRLDTGGHGFGIGKGTEAEGWVDDAVAFWASVAAEEATR